MQRYGNPTYRCNISMRFVRLQSIKQPMLLSRQMLTWTRPAPRIWDQNKCITAILNCSIIIEAMQLLDTEVWLNYMHVPWPVPCHHHPSWRTERNIFFECTKIACMHIAHIAQPLAWTDDIIQCVAFLWFAFWAFSTWAIVKLNTIDIISSLVCPFAWFIINGSWIKPVMNAEKQKRELKSIAHSKWTMGCDLITFLWRTEKENPYANGKDAERRYEILKHVYSTHPIFQEEFEIYFVARAM